MDFGAQELENLKSKWRINTGNSIWTTISWIAAIALQYEQEPELVYASVAFAFLLPYLFLAWDCLWLSIFTAESTAEKKLGSRKVLGASASWYRSKTILEFLIPVGMRCSLPFRWGNYLLWSGLRSIANKVSLFLSGFYLVALFAFFGNIAVDDSYPIQSWKSGPL